MQVGTQRVWDYIGGKDNLSSLSTNSYSTPLDNYVHRLVQNKGDGKLIEVEGQTDVSRK